MTHLPVVANLNNPAALPTSHVEVVSCLEKKKKAVSYREEEVEDCGCIYG